MKMIKRVRWFIDRFGLSKYELNAVMEQLESPLAVNTLPVTPDMNYPAPTVDTCPYPQNTKHNYCDPNALYPTFDGSCNNLKKPLWGKSFRALARFLPADYCDGTCASVDDKVRVGRRHR